MAAGASPWPTFSAASAPAFWLFFWPWPWSTASSRNSKGDLMKFEVDARQVTIFINSTDQWHGKALYTAIVQLCERQGVAGATVTRCVEGYGAGHHLHTAR